MPERYGPSQPVMIVLRKDGTWYLLLQHIQTKSDAVDEIEWIVSVNCTVIRAQ
jgi:hypothetical protein